MATIAERLDEDMKAALRAGQKERLGVIRRARAAIKNVEIDTKAELDDAAVEKVLRSLVKQHRDSIEQFTAGGRADRAEAEKAEMAVLEEYLPQQLDAASIEPVVREAIDEVGATSMKDMGAVMRVAMQKLGGAADGSVVNGIVKAQLAERSS